MIAIFKNTFIDKTAYLLLSVAIPSLLLWSGAPHFLVSNLVYEEAGIYWSYRFVNNLAWTILPCCGFVGALTTLKKKRLTLEDLFFNVSIGLVIFLTLKVMQKYQRSAVAIVFAALYCAVNCAVDVLCDERAEGMGTFKKLRLAYYKSRKHMVYLPLLVFTPMALYISHWENTNAEYRTIYEEIATNESLALANEWTATTDLATWLGLNAEERFEEAKKMTLYFLKDQKVDAEGMDIRASKALCDGEAVAYYSESEQCISININYLLDYGPDYIAKVVAHETRHAYDHQIIRELEAIEESGQNTELSCYDEAKALKAASESYREDSKTYNGYKNNLLEIRANQYAEVKMKELRELGYFD